MKCLRCGCENEPDSRFCCKCGMRLEPDRNAVPAGADVSDQRGQSVTGSRLTQTEKIVIAMLAAFALIIIIVFGVKSTGREAKKPVQNPPVTANSGEQLFPFLSGSEAVGSESTEKPGSDERKEKESKEKEQDSFRRLNSVKEVEEAAKKVADGSSVQTLFLVKADAKEIKTNVTEETLKAFADANGLVRKKGQKDPAYVDAGDASGAIGYSEKTGYYFMASGQSTEEALKFMKECGAMFFSGDAKKAYNAAVMALEKEPSSEEYECVADFVIGDKWMVEMDVSSKSPDGMNHSYAISIRDVESGEKK
uniref:zinc ribbon domain-containing protein n=1 Tax=Eubacterium cellulosolvens TaxID=29322 RepID=UPI000485D30B|nr:zinc ribbon domain-containing protein [[Eubacterium] cellulosolvens]